MIKKNLKLLIITSIVILLPILAGVILWNQLPEQIPSHMHLYIFESIAYSRQVVP